jgi:hypothetical protein
MIGKYSMMNMLKTYGNNKPLIDAYLFGSSVERLNDDDENDSKVDGLTIGIFISLFVISFAVWIWALIVTMKYWESLPQWALVLAVIGLVTGFGGPVMTLIVVYMTKGSVKGKSSKGSKSLMYKSRR